MTLPKEEDEEEEEVAEGILSLNFGLVVLNWDADIVGVADLEEKSGDGEEWRNRSCRGSETGFSPATILDKGVCTRKVISKRKTKTSP